MRHGGRVHFKLSPIYGLRKKSRRACPDQSGQTLRDLEGVGAWPSPAVAPPVNQVSSPDQSGQALRDECTSSIQATI
jgi:hypothetical protein